MQFSIKASIAIENYKLLQLIIINVIIYQFPLQRFLVCRCNIMFNTTIIILLYGYAIGVKPNRI